jgi:ABC-type molybdate transport system substrate-binding protein
MAEPLTLLAAGSLAAALGGSEWAGGRPVVAQFGASGLWRQAIEAGAPWDVFVSADTGLPARLHQTALATAPRILCHNVMCLLLRPGIAPEAASALLDRQDLRLGISTPGNDPSGDYALEVFRRADALRPGAGASLQARARRLTGAPDLPQAPEGRNTYAWLLETGAADLFLTYRSNAVAAAAELPGLGVAALPEPLAVRATYAVTRRADAPAAAEALLDHLCSSVVQARLAAHGLVPATTVRPEACP